MGSVRQQIATRIVTLGNRRSFAQLNQEIDEELDFHIHARADELTEQGLSHAEALAQANREFGNRDSIRHNCQRVYYGWQPWIAAVVVAVLLLTIVTTGWLSWSLVQIKQENLRLANELSIRNNAARPLTLAVNTLAQNNDRDVKGTVTDAEDKPVADAKILLIQKSWPGGSFRQQAYETTTDQDGKYAFENQYSTKIQNAFLVTVLAEGHEMSSKYKLYKAGQPAEEIAHELKPATRIEFTFVDSSGDPLDEAEVFVSNRKSGGIKHLIYEISGDSATWTTDENGRISFAFFSPGDVIELVVNSSEEKIAVRKRISRDAEQKITVKKSSEDAEVKRWEPAPVRNDAGHVDWIRQNAVALRSVDPADTDFSDLQGLKAIIGDARVVQLGEQSHGDGTAFETKIRLIKFLHQEMGFGLLAFESGFYDCHRAWQAFQRGDEALNAAKQGVFGIWTGSAQTKSLWEYISEQASGERPLQLAGFDCQFTAEASRQFLVDDLRDLIDRLETKGLSDSDWRIFQSQLTALIAGKEPGGSAEDFTKTVNSIRAALEMEEGSKIDADEVAFWRQQMESMSNHCARKFQTDGQPGDSQVNARDKQMAENFVWIARQRYPQRKIIVWAASFHIVRNPTDIQVPDKSVDYSEIVPMGHHVHEALGDEVFTVGFTAFDGRAGAFFRDPFKIGEAPEGTLESICHEAGLVNAMIPLRTGDDPASSWLGELQFSRPLGYGWMRSRWSDHFDAMIFNRTMQPSTR